MVHSTVAVSRVLILQFLNLHLLHNGIFFLFLKLNFGVKSDLNLMIRFRANRIPLDFLDLSFYIFMYVC